MAAPASLRCTTPRLPFTRMLAGPMDYTPGAFNNTNRENFIGRNNDADGAGNTRAGTGLVRGL